MKLQFLGGVREVGRSALLIDDRLLVDYGMATGNPPSFPVGEVDPEAVVVSHGHLDHGGTVPALLSGDARPPIHATATTAELIDLLARDTLKLQGGRYDCPFTRAELARLSQVLEYHQYDEPFEAAGYEVTLFDAGHIPGSAHVLIDDGDSRLLYTGDFQTEDSRLCTGTTARPDADVVVCESTYADVVREPRPAVEGRFVDTVERTLWNGGTVVVPAFAIGRTQEVMLVCAANDIDCYVDGMGTTVTEILRRNEDALADPAAFRRACANAREVTGRDCQRRRIAAESTVIVTTAGMLAGGPAMTYVPEIAGDPTNTLAFTGYQVEGTPGRELLDTGRAELDGRILPVSARIEAFDFSAHADREGLLSVLDTYRDARVYVVHGDRCGAFADELRATGIDASAPELGETVEV